MNFHVGQKVVAVGYKKDGSHVPPSIANLPQIGNIYTIRAINVWPTITIVRLYEVDNSHLLSLHQYAGQIEPGYDARAFRPLVTRKTNISIFKRMLTPSPEKVA